MKFDPSIHHRHSIRLKDDEPSQSGAYFITMVTQGRLNLFGEITDGVMCLSRIGETTRSAWLRLADLFPIRHDEWVLMPNHLHAILWILDLSTGEASTSQDFWDPGRSLVEVSPQRQANGKKSSSLGAIIQNFISTSTRNINQSSGEASRSGLRNAASQVLFASDEENSMLAMSKSDKLGKKEASPKRAERIWQRNYYERIIRDQSELERIRQYIADNPHQWESDKDNPEWSG